MKIIDMSNEHLRNYIAYFSGFDDDNSFKKVYEAQLEYKKRFGYCLFGYEDFGICCSDICLC